MLTVAIPSEKQNLRAAIAECRLQRKTLGSVRNGGPTARALCDHVADHFGLDPDLLLDAYLADVDRRLKIKNHRHAIADVYDSLGTKKVRGALGGVYWE